MCLYRLETADQESNKFMERVQTLAQWYIETAQYTENFDPRFFHYLAFESCGDGRLRFAGYATCYKFYHYDRTSSDMERIRISHFLLSPAYRQCGNGAKFLNAIYNDLRHKESVFDVTAEAPAESFIFMRDYTDCVNLSKMPEFSKQNLKTGMSSEMERIARKKFKMNRAQVRRVYEILRMDMEGPESKVFKEEVLSRIRRAMARTNRDWNKVSTSLSGVELSLLRQSQSEEVQQQQLMSQFNNCIEGYKIVLGRLSRYEPGFRLSATN